MGCGELTAGQFTTLLRTVFSQMVAHTNPGAIHQVCMAGATSPKCSRQVTPAIQSSRTCAYGTNRTQGWARSIVRNTNLSLFGRAARRLTLIISNSANMDDIVPTCGNTPVSTSSAGPGGTSWPCIQPSNQPHLSPTPSRTAPTAMELSWIRLREANDFDRSNVLAARRARLRSIRIIATSPSTGGNPTPARAPFMPRISSRLAM